MNCYLCDSSRNISKRGWLYICSSCQSINFEESKSPVPDLNVKAPAVESTIPLQQKLKVITLEQFNEETQGVSHLNFDLKETILHISGTWLKQVILSEGFFASRRFVIESTLDHTICRINVCNGEASYLLSSYCRELGMYHGIIISSSERTCSHV